MKLLHALLAALLLSQSLACWPDRFSPQNNPPPSPSTLVAPVPQISPSVREVEPRPTSRPLPSPTVSPPSKKRFEIFSVYPTPQNPPPEPEAQAQAPTPIPSPSPTEGGEEEVVIIPAVPTPQVIEFSGRPSPKPKE